MKPTPSPSSDLLHDLTKIINTGKSQVVQQVNSTLVLVYWQVGKRINKEILGEERASYGKEVVKGIAEELVKGYGSSQAY